MLSYLVFSFLFFSSRPEIDFADVVLQGEQWGLGGGSQNNNREKRKRIMCLEYFTLQWVNTQCYNTPIWSRVKETRTGNTNAINSRFFFPFVLTQSDTQGSSSASCLCSFKILSHLYLRRCPPVLLSGPPRRKTEGGIHTVPVFNHPPL